MDEEFAKQIFFVLIFLGILWAISNGGLRKIYNHSKKARKKYKKFKNNNKR
jgi:hypothetical protein|tara:strand:+ start:59 stop:211 length:153 start_codon:yes stop_codon:yes gene_type:complete